MEIDPDQAFYVKYAPESKKIVISVERLLNSSKVSVTGVREYLQMTFPTSLNDTARWQKVKDKSSGIGLGVSFSSEIIKKHGGEIGVDSIPDRVLPSGLRCRMNDGFI